MKRRLIRDYPRTVRVRDAIYKILFVKRVPDDRLDDLAGCCCSTTKTIWIAEGQTPQERAQTVVHELLHAIDAEYGLKLRHRLIYQLEVPLVDLIAELCGDT